MFWAAKFLLGVKYRRVKLRDEFTIVAFGRQKPAHSSRRLKTKTGADSCTHTLGDVFLKRDREAIDNTSPRVVEGKGYHTAAGANALI